MMMRLPQCFFVPLLLISSSIISVLVDGSPDATCLKCICQVSTNCELNPCDEQKCSNIDSKNFNCACGPFSITPPYWMAANKTDLNGETATEAEKFRKCVETFPCSILTVRYYLEKYAEDCNGDKKIDCDDYILVHNFGPKACFHSALEPKKFEKYSQCMGIAEQKKAVSTPGSMLEKNTTVDIPVTERNEKTSTDSSSNGGDDTDVIGQMTPKMRNGTHKDDVCNLEGDRGNYCHREESFKWFYNKTLDSCSTLWYKGCGGNGNRFSDRRLCVEACENKGRCGVPPKLGNCEKKLRWFYNLETKHCQEFIYTGCGFDYVFHSINECRFFCERN